MAGFRDDRALAAGSLLLAELALGMYRDLTGQGWDECVQELTLSLDAAVAPR